MEPWQATAIRKNLYELQWLTNCEASFLALLQGRDILGNDDLSLLEAKRLLEGSIAQSALLYKIVQKRKGGFDALLEACRTAVQTGALHILEHATIQRENDEDWQSEWIRKNLATLIRTTTCTPEFLSELSQFLDSEDDLALAKASKLETGEAKLLYGFAMEKEGMYEVVTRALFQTGQYKAFQLLLNGFIERRIEGILKICNISAQDERLAAALEGFEMSLALQYPVSFQGHELLVSQLVPEIDKTTLQNLATDLLEGHFVSQMINKEAPQLDNNSIPDLPNYYISRKIVSRNCLDKNLFDSQNNDIFVIKGIQPLELSKLTQSRDNTRFMLLEKEEDFGIFSQYATTQRSVHLLNHDAGQFTWIKSHGCISRLQAHVIDGKTKKTMSENEFLERCIQTSETVCIVDTPGMGKSMLLANIGDKIRRQCPNRLVRFVVMQELVPELEKRGGGEIHKNILLNLIADQSSESKFGKEIVRNLLLSETIKVELLLDGFDEVLTSQMGIAQQILKIILSLKSVRLFITTRPHMRDELERLLGVLSYNMESFGRDEQLEFLTAFWSKNNTAQGNERLKEFAARCLEALKKTVNDFEHNFAGIPLLCRLLAEVYEKEAVNYSKCGNVMLDNVIPTFNIFDLYDKLTNSRFEILGSTENNEVREHYFEAHIIAAVQLLFPQLLHSFCNPEMRNFYLDDKQLCSLGILEQKHRTDSTPRFVHRTLAEHMFGLLIIDVMNMHACLFFQMFCDRFRFYEYFFHTVLHTTTSIETPLRCFTQTNQDSIRILRFSHPVVCYFIKLGKPSLKFWTEDHFSVYESLSASAIHGFERLYKEISEAHDFLIRDHPSRIPSLHLVAAKYSTIEIFKVVQQQVLDCFPEKPSYITCSSPYFMITPLHVIVERGNYEFLAEFLPNSKAYVDLEKLKYVLHCCVASSGSDSDSVIDDKVKIIQTLAALNPSWINEPLDDGTTPLLQKNIHFKLLELLVELGAEVNSVNRYGSVLHNMGGNEESAEQYLEGALKLLEIGFDQFSTVDWKKTSLTLINFLLRYGSYLKHSNFNGDNALHVCAKWGHLQAFEDFLLSDEIGDTDVNTENLNGLTPFMEASKVGKGLTVRIITLMEEKGLQVSQQVASTALRNLMCNKNIMSWELGAELANVADYLMSKGGVLSGKDCKCLWELEFTKTNLASIAKAVDCDCGHDTDPLSPVVMPCVMKISFELVGHWS
ncbi:unnamed protein product [Orchesella dallaii]|uniref:NACHT domain-containing protein n=1 Tax=Orchesella dallaii TaxID=48710 RepID=A0ABP1RJD2_9HEXA